MGMYGESGSADTRSRAPRITTLYDLLAEINLKLFGPQWQTACGSKTRTQDDEQCRLIAEEVADLFDSGRIRFRNIRDVSSACVELLACTALIREASGTTSPREGT
ncbi:MAG: hypothetical protein ABFD70_07150 [Syntrophaceae bacterium]|nr:hypothetical protein [Deltaproteobacteria bacterium]